MDLWALGVILYSMLAGFPPFYNESNPALIRQIRRAEFAFHSPYWDDVSAEARALVSGLLVVDPAQRFTVHQCLEHPWIRGAGEASSKKLHRPAPAARAARAPVCREGMGGGGGGGFVAGQATRARVRCKRAPRPEPARALARVAAEVCAEARDPM